FFGSKEEEIIGKTDFDFVDKELAEFFRENDKKAIYENKARLNTEWVTFASDGHKELLQTIKTPMYDYSGNLIGVLGVARDITELYNSQEEIKNKEEIYSAIVNRANDSIALIDFEDATFFKFNESAYKNLGYTKEEFEKMHVYDIEAIQNKEEVFNNFTYLKESNINSFETKHKTKLGEIRDIRASVKYIEIKNKAYIASIWSDITEKNKIQKEIKMLNQNLEEKVKERTILLEQANKELESFAYSVSHDLRAPIRHIDGFSALLKNSLKNITPESEQYFQKINLASSKMSKMIDDLLKFSRLGRKVLEKTDVDLNILIKEVIEQYKPDIVGRNVEFIIGELPIVKGDKGLLQIVFENLISNALKFTSKKDLAIIEINQCENCNKGCNIYIKDNGVGFDMTYVDKLFGVFQRLHTEREFTGTGIGLANIKQIIQKHGGTIRGEGEIDKGATFYVYL
ncbi:MAG: PAS domain S-box protein, partial [Candidatus Sericytochromatia bacterium]